MGSPQIVLCCYTLQLNRNKNIIIGIKSEEFQSKIVFTTEQISGEVPTSGFGFTLPIPVIEVIYLESRGFVTVLKTQQSL